MTSVFCVVIRTVSFTCLVDNPLFSLTSSVMSCAIWLGFMVFPPILRFLDQRYFMTEFYVKLLEALYSADELANQDRISKMADKLPHTDTWVPDLSHIEPKSTFRCPRCHAPAIARHTILTDCYPLDSKHFYKDIIFIRYHAKGNWSQCLICAGYFRGVDNYLRNGDPDVLWYSKELGDPDAGWFK
jgi:hypothetical protein